MKSSKGVFLPGLTQDSEALGREFVKSPEAFAKRMGVSVEDLACPPEAHDAFERGQSFADAAREAKLEPSDAAMAPLESLARKKFGDDYAVSLIPFGLQFRERANLTMDITATASGTITWLESDADVDG